MISVFSAPELIGYVAVVFSTSAFLTHSKKKMRVLGSISLLLFMVSVFLNGGINAAFVSLLSLIIRVLSIFISEEKLKIFKYLAPILALVSLPFLLSTSSEGWISALPAIALIVVIFADLQKDILAMKKIYTINLFIWLVYAIGLGSLSAFLYEFLGLLALLYAIRGLGATQQPA